MYFLQSQERDVTCGYTDDIVEKSYDCYSLLLVIVIMHNTIICKKCCLISFCVNARLIFCFCLEKTQGETVLANSNLQALRCNPTDFDYWLTDQIFRYIILLK